MVLITNPVSSTVIIALVLAATIVVTSRKKEYSTVFPTKLTNELKGFAILAIVFSHIGYLLSSTDRFLWPLSILAGVGVNLFLFLSGYGLTLSGIKKQPTFLTNAHRLLKIFIPLWIVLTLYFALDYLIHGNAYSVGYIAKSFAGLFLRADATQDVNSVLWYFSLVLFYYIVFPLLFIRKHIWAGALGLIAISTFVVLRDPLFLHDVMRLYQVHILAFPIGMLIAWATTIKSNKYYVRHKIAEFYKVYLAKTDKQNGSVTYVVTLLLLAALISYSAVHSFVDQQPVLEQLSSLLTMFLIILFFIIKRFEVGIFALFGYVSFEVYLLHWPLLSRYDVLYAHTPPWFATLLYLVIFLVLGYLLRASAGKLYKLIVTYF